MKSSVDEIRALMEEVVRAAAARGFPLDPALIDWNIERGSARTLRQWVEQGGVLCLWPKAASLDEFNAPLDLFAFLGSTAIAFGLLAMGEPLGLLGDGTPDWLWVATILMIDVAHVYAFAYFLYQVNI